MVAPSVKVVLLFAVLVGSLNAAILSSPVVNDEPNYKEYAKMARFLVHRLDWMSMATISADPPTLGYPMAGVISHSDSAIGEKSTGEVYMFLTDLDQHEQNLNQNNKLTLLFAMAQYKNCSDPMEPTCARLMMTGTRVKLVPGTEEHAFGMNALLSRHPNAVHWDLSKKGGWGTSKSQSNCFVLFQPTLSTWPR